MIDLIGNLNCRIKTPWFKEIKPLVVLSCALLMCMVAATAVSYKIINVFGWAANGGSLLFTLTFPISVLVAEIYGSEIGKFVISSVIVLAFCFSLIIVLVIHLPAPLNIHQDAAYKSVLGNSLRLSVIGTIASLIAFRINIIVVTRFKKITQGRWFILRYLSSTAFGEFALATIATFGAFVFIIPLYQIVQIWLFSYCFKLVTTTILAWPTTILALYMKKVSGMDVY
jgi:uncharacterized integral membrane protein (TIGR00697 family)